MNSILGTKQHMTQLFKDDGTVIAVTVVKVAPGVVTQIKTQEKDGYDAIQYGFFEQKEHLLKKPIRGHVKKSGATPKKLIEFRSNSDDQKDIKIGDKITIELFEPGDKLAVTGISKGKGFQGVVKRHRFSGGPASHGHKDQNRMPGSIGATDPGRVFKGKKMGGQMGNKKATVKNLEIAKIDTKEGALYIKGAVPGSRGSLLAIKTI